MDGILLNLNTDQTRKRCHGSAVKVTSLSQQLTTGPMVAEDVLIALLMDIGQGDLHGCI